MVDDWGLRPGNELHTPDSPPTPHVQPGKDTPTLRVGNRVRVTRGDWFVTAGLTGIVVNVASPRPFKPQRARILFDNGQVCQMDETDFLVVPPPSTKRMQPVMMPTFWREGSHD